MKKSTIVTSAVNLPEPDPDVPEQPEYAAVVIAEAPKQPIQRSGDREVWQWPEIVRGRIKRLQVNSGIREWMEADPDFANWVRTCLLQHAINVNHRLEESTCYIPDRWREDVGEKIVIVSTNAIPGLKGNEHVDGAYHVMV